METKIQEIINCKDYILALGSIIKNFQSQSFIKVWEKNISEILNEEGIRINSLIIGTVGELPDRIYAGANSNTVLVFEFDGTYLERIELDEGVEVKKLLISDIKNNQSKKELIIHTSDDTVLFYGINNKGAYQELPNKIISQKAEITTLFSVSINDENKSLFIGNSNGDVLGSSYTNIQLDLDDQLIIPNSEKLVNEKIAAISGSKSLLDGNFGLVVGYKNGIVLLFNERYELVSKIDIDREIEDIYTIEKSQSIIITTDDNNIYRFEVKNNQLINEWNYYINTTISTLIPDLREDSPIEYFVVSEDYGTISSCAKDSTLIFTGDPSFEGTTGVFYNEKLILGSREGEICQFNIIGRNEYEELQKVIFDSYAAICLSKDGNDFFEFFNSEFESEERAGYFKTFLIKYLSSSPEESVINKIDSLFKERQYNTDLADGLISKIKSNSQLRDIFLTVFHDSHVSHEIINFDKRIDYKIKETNLLEQAKLALKTDPVQYITLMSEIMISKVDRIWVEKVFEDDDVVGIEYYHSPLRTNEFQILIATRKGYIFLLDRHTGKIIWNFKLDPEDGEITNIEVADICNDGSLEIIIGCKNRQNSILILCSDKDKFSSADNKIQLDWHPGFEQDNNFNLYYTRTRVPGIDDVYTVVHNVHCFDFDNNGISDLIISSENGKFDIFYFDNNNRSRIIPRTDAIKYDDDDVLVFEIIRGENHQIVLYTGSASGTIDKHIYNGQKFLRTTQTFTERDARITDMKVVEIENEKVVLYSSEDSFIYCLTSDLEYKWAFRTGANARSIGISRFNDKEFIFAISKDNKLYALDKNGNKKWDYPLYSPLDKLFIFGDEIVVADSDGNIHMLLLKNAEHIANTMEAELAGIDIDLSFFENLTSQTYARIYAARKLLLTNPDDKTLSKLIPLVSDGIESEELVRCETIKLFTTFLLSKDTFNLNYARPLVAALDDYSSDVRIEAIKSFFKLIEKYKANNIDVGAKILKMTEDDDIWVKEFLAGILNKNVGLRDADKWKALLNLLKLNKNEEWVLNETSNSIGSFLNNVHYSDSLVNYFNEFFENDFEPETFLRVKNKIISTKIAHFFDLYFKILFGNISMIKEAFNLFLKEYPNDNTQVNLLTLIDKVKSSLNIIDQISIDDVINDQLLDIFSMSFKNSSTFFIPIIDNLNEYSKENSISRKIVYLNYASDSIDALPKLKSNIHIIDWRLIKLTIKDHFSELISKTSRLLRDNVYLDIEMENREVLLNENGIVDVNFNIINKGYNKIEEIEVNVKRNTQFDVIENIGEIGELVKSQNKKVYFKIKPKVIGALDIVLEITYKGSEISIISQERVFIKEAVQKEWVVIPNPYTAGIPIENNEIFVGRETLIQEVVTALKKDPVFVMGHRRMGKTSLIKYIQRNYLSSEEFIPVFVSAEKMVFDTMKDFLFSFTYPIACELQDLEIMSEEKTERYLDNIRENGLIDFGIFFNDVLRKIKKLNRTLILIIDEYPIIHEQVNLNKIDAQFISNLRGYMQNNSKEFKMIYSGASSLKYLKSQYSSNIMGVGKSIEVSFLSQDDVKTLISKPLNNQMKLEDSAFQYLMDLTNGQPFLVQVILNYLVDKLNKEKTSSMVFKEALEDGLDYFLIQAPHLKNDWGVFDDSEDNRFLSSDLTWSSDEEKIAKAYKQLIITAITENWKKSKNGLSNIEISNKLKESMKDFHKFNLSIFDETMNIMAGTSDILKEVNSLYFIKVGLFREWVINKMNFSFEKTLMEIRYIFTNLKIN
jgi:outer membrane protein assembly factor BamB